MRVGLWEKGICPKCEELLERSAKGKGRRLRANSKSSRKRKSNYQTQLQRAKKAFQKLRRAEEADHNGMVSCCCGAGMFKWNDGRRVNGGHFYPAERLGTCFDPDNVWPQGAGMNMRMHDPIVNNRYRQFMLDKFGQDKLDEMESRSLMPKKYNAIELEQMAKEYEAKIRRIIKEKGI